MKIFLKDSILIILLTIVIYTFVSDIISPLTNNTGNETNNNKTSYLIPFEIKVNNKAVNLSNNTATNLNLSQYSQLLNAIENNNVSQVAFILNNGFNLRWRIHKEKKQFLDICLKEYKPDILKLLLKNGITLKYEKSFRSQIMDWSFKNFDPQMISWLTKNGMDLSEVFDNGDTALVYACKWHRYEYAKELIVNNTCTTDLYKEEIPTLIHYLVKTMPEKKIDPDLVDDLSLEIINLLMQKGIELNVNKSFENTTLLNLASSKLRTNLVKFLIKNSAEVNLKAKWGATPLHLACFNKQDSSIAINTISFLLDSGADITANRNRDTIPLNSAIESNTAHEIILYMISRGADIHFKNSRDETPLHYAMFRTNPDMVEYLIDRSLDVNSKDKDGNTPLMFFLLKGLSTTSILRSLITNGADVNTKNNKGLSPLHLAANREYYNSVMRYLIKSGAEVNAKDNKGRTPLYYAKNVSRGKGGGGGNKSGEAILIKHGGKE